MSQFYGAVVSALGLTVVVITLQRTGALQPLEKSSLDTAFRLRSRQEQGQPITVIAIDEVDLQRLGQWPVSDAQLAEALRRIHQAQPSVIGLNLHRHLPVQPGTEELEALFATLPNLIGIRKVQRQAHELALNAPKALTLRGQVAASDLLRDRDGKLRRHLLSLRDRDRTVVLSLGARLALDYLEQRGVQQELLDAQTQRIRLGRTVFQALSAFEGGYADVDVGGYQILSNFHDSPESFERLSLAAILEGSFDPQQLRDRIVLLGSTAPSLQNAFFTPATRTPAEAWSGVDLQADLAAQIVAAALDGRSLLRGVPPKANWLWILFWASLGAVWGSYLPSQRASLLCGLPALLLVLMGAGYGLFLGGWWIAIVAPGLALSGAALLSRRLLLGQHLFQSQASLLHFQAALAQSEQRLKRAKVQNRAKDTLVARFSHELRTPLNAILGFSRLLCSDARLDDNQREDLGIINSNGEYLMTMLNEVLDLSKVEAQKLSLNPSIVDLSELLLQLEALFRLQAQQKGLTLSIVLKSQRIKNVWLDEIKLRQVLINLLSNAIKFTETGQVTLRVTPCAQARLQFEVEDTGPGIPETEIASIFEPFVQGPVFNQSQPGSGLGLSISRVLVQLMGGELWVETKPNQGARFHFSLPFQMAEEVQDEEGASPLAPKASESLHGFESTTPPMLRPSFNDQVGLTLPVDPISVPMPADYRILVVDDGPCNRRLLCKMLRDVGYRVREAVDGQTALEKWERWHPHLILLDIQMPGMSGYEVARQIRRREAAEMASSSLGRRGQSVGMIAISGGVSREEQADAIAAGCDEFLPKPFQRQELLALIVRHLLLGNESD